MGLAFLMFAIAGIIFAVGAFAENGNWIEAGLFIAIVACVVWAAVLAIGG